MLTMFMSAGMEGWFRETFTPVDDPTGRGRRSARR
jgi:hypothetical protein